MTRSGSLTNEVTAEVVRGGFGVSTLIGAGGKVAKRPSGVGRLLGEFLNK